MVNAALSQPWSHGRLAGGIVVAALVATGVSGCASSAATPTLSARTLEVKDQDGELLYAAPSSFVIRRPEHVVQLKGLGELHVGVGDDPDACRFVWSREGLAALTVFEGAGCSRPVDGRVCFDAARFVRDAGSDSVAPRTLIVRGCAEENTIFYGRLGDSGPELASVGPKSYRRRCVEAPKAKRGCRVVFVRRDDLVVEHNPDGGADASFTFDDDDVSVCFLEARAGRYRLQLTVEDSCGTTQTHTLDGHSDDLLR